MSFSSIASGMFFITTFGMVKRWHAYICDGPAFSVKFSDTIISREPVCGRERARACVLRAEERGEADYGNV